MFLDGLGGDVEMDIVFLRGCTSLWYFIHVLPMFTTILVKIVSESGVSTYICLTNRVKKICPIQFQCDCLNTLLMLLIPLLLRLVCNL